MNHMMTKGEKIFQICNNVFMLFLCVIMIYPFIHIVSISFSTTAEAMREGLHIFPREFSLDAYIKAFKSDGLQIGFYNSVFRTVVGTAISILLMICGAYPISRKQMPLKRFFTMFMLLTMFISGGLVPTYMLVKGIPGLYNSVWALIIPCLINTFSLLIFKNFFSGLPVELEESAKIDGATDIRILFRIVLPLSMPIIATVVLWTATYHWNAWFDALIYTSDRKKMVLQLYLRKLIVDSDINEFALLTGAELNYTPETLKAAVLMIVTVPILLVYPFLQKYYVKGVLVGSIKG